MTRAPNARNSTGELATVQGANRGRRKTAGKKRKRRADETASRPSGPWSGRVEERWPCLRFSRRLRAKASQVPRFPGTHGGPDEVAPDENAETRTVMLDEVVD